MKKLLAVISIMTLVTPQSFAAGAWLEQVKGDVKIQQNKKDWVKASSGVEVHEGDQIKTGPKSTVILSLQKAKVSIYENSDFKLTEYNTKDGNMRTELGLEEGQLEANVQKLLENEKLEIVSPTNVAAVRGTQLFYLAFKLMGRPYTRTVVSEGLVKYCTLNRQTCVMVKEGEYATGDENSIIGPKKQEDEEDLTNTEDQTGFDQEAAHAQENPEQFNPPSSSDSSSQNT